MYDPVEKPEFNKIECFDLHLSDFRGNKKKDKKLIKKIKFHISTNLDNTI